MFDSLSKRDLVTAIMPNHSLRIKSNLGTCRSPLLRFSLTQRANEFSQINL